MYRQGPYKKQASKFNPSRPAKVFHVPSDHTVTSATYIPQQTFSMSKVKRDQREMAYKRLHEENQKVLERIVSQKPTIQIEKL